MNPLKKCDLKKNNEKRLLCILAPTPFNILNEDAFFKKIKLFIILQNIL